MTQEIIHEADLLLYSMALGVCIIFAYDVLYALRRAIHHRLIFVGLEDFAYLAACTISFFMLFYECNSGVVRGYAVGGMILGMYVYHKLLSQYLVFIMSTVLKKTIHLVVEGLKVVTKPVKVAFYKAAKIAKKVVFKAKTGLTVCIKSSKLILCKHSKSGNPTKGKKSRRSEKTEEGRANHGRNRHSKKSRSQKGISEKKK